MTDQRTTSLDVLEERVARLRERPVPATDKALGWLAAAGPVTSAGLAAERPAIWDFELPVMVAHESALAHNIEAMATYCAAAGVSHAPHGKTPDGAAAGRPPARGRGLGRVGRHRRPGPGVPVLRRAPGADRQPAHHPPGHRVAGPRAGRRPGLRVLHLRRQPGRRGPARRGPARGRPPAASSRCWSSWATPAAGPAAGASTRRWPWPPRCTTPTGWSWPARPGSRAASSAEIWTRHWLRWPCSSSISGPSASGCPASPTAAAPADPQRGRQLVLRRRLPRAGPGRRPGRAAQRRLRRPRPRPLRRERPGQPPDAARPAAQPRVRGRAGAVGGRAVGARAGPGHRQRRPPRHLLRPGHARAAAGAPVRGDRARGRNAADQPRRPARLPEHHRHTGPLAPGDLVSLGSTHPCTTMDKWPTIPVVDDDDRVIDAVHTFF